MHYIREWWRDSTSNLVPLVALLAAVAFASVAITLWIMGHGK